MIIHNARLRGRDGLHRITLNGERIAAIDAQHALQAKIKAVFDPHGILNPGKVFTP